MRLRRRKPVTSIAIQQNSRLLKLAPELRNMVYDLVLQQWADRSTNIARMKPVRRWNASSLKHDSSKVLHALSHYSDISLRLTCRRISKETSNYVFHTLCLDNIMVLSYHHSFTLMRETKKFRAIFQDNLDRFKHIKVDRFLLPLPPRKCPLEPNARTLFTLIRGYVNFKISKRFVRIRNPWPVHSRCLTSITVYGHCEKRGWVESLVESLGLFIRQFEMLIDIRVVYTDPGNYCQRFRVQQGSKLHEWYTSNFLIDLAEYGRFKTDIEERAGVGTLSLAVTATE